MRRDEFAPIYLDDLLSDSYHPAPARRAPTQPRQSAAQPQRQSQPKSQSSRSVPATRSTATPQRRQTQLPQTSTEDELLNASRTQYHQASAAEYLQMQQATWLQMVCAVVMACVAGALCLFYTLSRSDQYLFYVAACSCPALMLPALWQFTKASELPPAESSVFVPIPANYRLATDGVLRRCRKREKALDLGTRILYGALVLCVVFIMVGFLLGA